jgi:hypothetical protein
VAPKESRTADGITFASRAEMVRYLELRLMESRGEIMELECQPRFPIIPKGARNRAHVYTADFQYLSGRGGRTVVEEVKGVMSQDYILRRDLFLQRYPNIIFREVRNGKTKEFV